MAAQQALDDEGRTRVHLERVAAVEGADLVQVALQRGCEGFGRGLRCRFGRGLLDGQGRVLSRERTIDEAADAGVGFTAGAGVITVQSVKTRAPVGVDHGQGRVFLGHVLERGHQNGVLEHIGVVARMEGVAVTEHGANGNGPGPEQGLERRYRGGYLKKSRPKISTISAKFARFGRSSTKLRTIGSASMSMPAADRAGEDFPQTRLLSP